MITRTEGLLFWVQLVVMPFIFTWMLLSILESIESAYTLDVLITPSNKKEAKKAYYLANTMAIIFTLMVTIAIDVAFVKIFA